MSNENKQSLLELKQKIDNLIICHCDPDMTIREANDRSNHVYSVLSKPSES